jgi:hypothetical protein
VKFITNSGHQKMGCSDSTATLTTHFRTITGELADYMLPKGIFNQFMPGGQP